MTDQVGHGATILAKRDELYAKLSTKYNRRPALNPIDRAAFDIAWEAKNNYADIEALYISILHNVVDEARAQGVRDGSSLYVDGGLRDWP